MFNRIRKLFKKSHPTQADVDVRTLLDLMIEHFGRALCKTEPRNPSNPKKEKKNMSPVVAELRITRGAYAGECVQINAEKAALIVSEHAFAADNRKQFQQDEYFIGGKSAYRTAYKAGEFENPGIGVFQALSNATGAVLDQHRAVAKAQSEGKVNVAASYGLTVAQLDAVVAAAQASR